MRFVLTLLLTVLSFLAGSASGSAGTVARVEIGTTMEVKNVGIDDRSFGIWMGLLTHKSLTRFSPEGSMVGELASSWDSPDGRVWTFRIRPDVKWQDGKEVTAEDVAFTYKYLREKFPVYVRHFNLLEDVQAVDNRTVVVRLVRPNSQFTVNVSGIWILPKHIFEGVADPSSFFGPKAALGCGPFLFQSFDSRNGTLTFVANPDHAPRRSRVDSVRIRSFKNADTLYLALKKGEIDLPFHFPMGNDVPLLQSLQGASHLSLPSIGNLGAPKALFFNTGKPPADDPALRRALSMAVDYQAMLDLFSGGFGRWPKSGFVPEGLPGFIETDPLVHSPQDAASMLERLGFVDVDGDGIREYGGRPWVLDCVVSNDSVENVRVAERLKGDFRKIGVDFAPRYVDLNVFQSIVNREKNYTLLLHRTTSWGMLSWAGYGSAYVDDRNMGWTRTNDAVLYGIIDRMNESMDERAYRLAAADLQRYYSKNLCAIPLYWNSLVLPYNNRLSGWKVDAVNGLLNPENWFSVTETVHTEKASGMHSGGGGSGSLTERSPHSP